MKTEANHTAQTYFLRCWFEPGEAAGGPLWRFSLEDVRTGRRRGFPSLEALMIALQIDLQGPVEGQPENQPQE